MKPDTRHTIKYLRVVDLEGKLERSLKELQIVEAPSLAILTSISKQLCAAKVFRHECKPNQQAYLSWQRMLTLDRQLQFEFGEALFAELTRTFEITTQTFSAAITSMVEATELTSLIEVAITYPMATMVPAIEKAKVSLDKLIDQTGTILDSGLKSQGRHSRYPELVRPLQALVLVVRRVRNTNTGLGENLMRRLRRLARSLAIITLMESQSYLSTLGQPLTDLKTIRCVIDKGYVVKRLLPIMDDVGFLEDTDIVVNLNEVSNTLEQLYTEGVHGKVIDTIASYHAVSPKDAPNVLRNIEVLKEVVKVARNASRFDRNAILLLDDLQQLKGITHRIQSPRSVSKPNQPVKPTIPARTQAWITMAHDLQYLFSNDSPLTMAQWNPLYESGRQLYITWNEWTRRGHQLSDMEERLNHEQLPDEAVQTIIDLLQQTLTPEALIHVVVAQLCVRDGAQLFAERGSEMVLTAFSPPWIRIFHDHLHARQHQPDRHRQLHSRYGHQTNAKVTEGQPLGLKEWFATVRSKAYPPLSKDQRRRLLALAEEIIQSLRNSTSRPPSGWKARIQDHPFLGWGWETIGVGAAAYQWGCVRIETGSGPIYEFNIGPEIRVELGADALLVAYTWVLAWIEGASHPNVVLEDVRDWEELQFHPLTEQHMPTKPIRQIDRRWGTMTAHSRTPMLTQKRRNSQKLHVVRSHTRWVHPGFIAGCSAQEAAKVALVALPVGYTFVNQHWSPRSKTPKDDVWVRVQWTSDLSMPQWRKVMGLNTEH